MRLIVVTLLIIFSNFAFANEDNNSEVEVINLYGIFNN